MKFLLIACLALASVAAHAASPEQDYLAARDRYVAEFKTLEESGQADERATKQEQDARGDLERRLEKILGPVAVEGFSAPGRLSLETLFSQDVGAEQLDGLVFSSADKGELLVSTKALLESWLGARRKGWIKTETAPAALEQASRSDFFYTLAISPDAGVVRYADLPIAKPAAADFAAAMLDQRSQDITGATLPSEIIVTLARAGKVLIVSTPARTKIGSTSACDAIWADYAGKSDKALAAYAASGRTDDKLFDESTRLQDEGGAAFRRCFAEQAKKEKFFADLTEEAQALADRLAK
jgi:hypothetical protein